MKQDVSLERSANRYTVSVHYFIKKEIAFPIIFCYSIKQNLKAVSKIAVSKSVNNFILFPPNKKHCQANNQKNL